MAHPEPTLAPSFPPSAKARADAVSRTALVGAAINLVLSVLKIAGGLLGHSQALVADGIYSLSDLLSDALVLWAGIHAV